MFNAYTLWPRFMVSLLLHGVILCAACLWIRQPVSAIPVFQGGEISIDLDIGLPATPTVAIASLPPAATEPQPADIEEEPEKPPAIVEPTPEEEEEETDEMQLVHAASSAAMPAPTPVLSTPATPGQAEDRTQTAAAPITGAANPGLPGAPRLASNIHPIYPPGARLRGEEGAVTVCAIVTPAGKAQTAEIVRSSGYAALDQSAINAVRRARFIPARKGRLPVESETRLTFRFTLVD